LQNLARECIRILRSQELGVGGEANVDETPYRASLHTLDLHRFFFCDTPNFLLNRIVVVVVPRRLRANSCNSARRRMERRELNAVPIDLADIEVCADRGDVGRRDVVCGAPDAFGRGVLGYCKYVWVLQLKEDGERRTSSVNVSQCFLSINVTTRPGASGVPLWSSLQFYEPCYSTPSIQIFVVPRLNVLSSQSHVDEEDECNILAKSAGRSLRCIRVRADLHFSSALAHR
jgi:hypothetical protein